MGTLLYVFIEFARERGGIPLEIFTSASNSLAAVYMCAGFVYNRFQVASEALKDIVCIRESHRANSPSMQEDNVPKNRRIDDLSPEEAYRWTRFTKEQLHHLLLHLRMP
jgi:hypothetical protein